MLYNTRNIAIFYNNYKWTISLKYESLCSIPIIYKILYSNYTLIKKKIWSLFSDVPLVMSEESAMG